MRHLPRAQGNRRPLRDTEPLSTSLASGGSERRAEKDSCVVVVCNLETAVHFLRLQVNDTKESSDAGSAGRDKTLGLLLGTELANQNLRLKPLEEEVKEEVAMFMLKPASMLPLLEPARDPVLELVREP
ncbi:hypothetical protein EYF80_030523 [Liparis tanakae]|uniref:Uncharacterized protein n=1 Tax=Liparis tanakae TaxID=230148 RepID=A0A4Z2H065_9TELE|nr:hypothetical protein EYF80_030523 [Liparis tanakae]